MTTLTEYDRLQSVLVKHVRDAFIDEATIAAQWKALNFTAPPDLGRAIDEHDGFIEILRSNGTVVHLLPRESQTTLDSIYVRDASIVSTNGLILCVMGKADRVTEPAAQERALKQVGVALAGQIVPPGRLEGGDLIWLDSETIAVGCGYRTNAEGIGQLRTLVGNGVNVVEVPLPHWRGERDVMHLMSLISPVDKDLAVVYLPLLTERFRQFLLDRGYRFVEVPDDEFETMGTNVLALGPRDCVMLDGNPKTRAALERAGARVQVYQGREISLKGGGGPTCLTRPLTRVGDA